MQQGKRRALNTAQAHRWGIKAAMAGLPATSNPYLNPQARAAWLQGYNQANSQPSIARTR
jgi:ribosome modulation factor